MRSYPRNSPEAAARIVALIMVADGHVSRSEITALDRLHASTRLGLAPADTARVLRGLTEDLMCSAFAPWGSSCHISEELAAGPAGPRWTTPNCAPPPSRCAWKWRMPMHTSLAPKKAFWLKPRNCGALGTVRYVQPAPQRPCAMTL